MTTREVEVLGAAIEALVDAGLNKEVKRVARIMQGEKALKVDESEVEADEA